MILEVSAENLRDVAAAVHAARKREPREMVVRAIERKVLSALGSRAEALELDAQEAQALRNILLMRAHDQRRTAAANEYIELADRIRRDLEVQAPPLDETPHPHDTGG